MAFRWEYPIYVIPLGGGFVSIVDPDTTDDPVHSLAVFTHLAAASSFVEVCDIPEAPRPLDSAHQFAWLLQSLQAPVTQVAFNPNPSQPEVAAAWIVSVEQLLRHEFVADRSPWKYPVFVVRQPTGFASIEGQANDGQCLTAVCMFTDRSKAVEYLADTPEPADIQALDDRKTVREFLRMVAFEATAVALNPVIRDGRHAAEYCVDIAILIEKYLADTDDV